MELYSVGVMESWSYGVMELYSVVFQVHSFLFVFNLYIILYSVLSGSLVFHVSHLFENKSKSYHIFPTVKVIPCLVFVSAWYSRRVPL